MAGMGLLPRWSIPHPGEISQPARGICLDRVRLPGRTDALWLGRDEPAELSQRLHQKGGAGAETGRNAEKQPSFAQQLLRHSGPGGISQGPLLCLPGALASRPAHGPHFSPLELERKDRDDYSRKYIYVRRRGGTVPERKEPGKEKKEGGRGFPPRLERRRL